MKLKQNKAEPESIKQPTDKERFAGGQVMPVAAFVDRKKVEEERAQAEQAKQAASIAAEEAKAEYEAEAERSLKEWLLEVLHDPRKIVKVIKRYRLAAIALVSVTSMTLAFYLAALPLYYSYLFNAGERALENKEYNDSIEHINRYLSNNSGDVDAMLLLVKAHLLSKRFGEAEQILAGAEGNTKIIRKAEFWYYRAGLHLLTAPKKPNPYINKSLDIAPEHVPTLLVRGLDSIAKRNWQEAQSDFRRLLLIVEGSNYSEEDIEIDIDFWMNYYFDNQLLPAISFTPELSFSELSSKAPIADNLGFDIDHSGFQNLYYVPYDLGFLADMDVPDVVSFLLLVTYVIDDKRLEAKVLLDSTYESEGIWRKYYYAYLEIKTGNYADAAKQYNEIIIENPSSDSLAMFANALWADSQGGKPTKQLLSYYEAAYDADKKNIMSANNLAFMKIYTGDEDEALSLLQEAIAEGGGSDSHIAINMALLDLSLGGYKAARPKIYALLEADPESLLLLNAALLIERELDNYQPAINIANTIKKLLPDSGRVYLDIASIYKQDGNYLLELSELEKGYKEYPLNTDIVAELALSYIKNRQYKKAARVLQYAISNISDDYRVLWAQGKLHAQTDAKAAGDFFREAVEKSPLSKKADVVSSLGRFYLSREKPENALETSTLAKGYNERQDFDLLALRLRANTVLNINGVSEEEIKQAMRIMTEENVSVPAQIDIAWVFFLRGEIGQAISILKKLTSGKVLSLEVLNLLNIAYLEKGAVEEAQTTRNRIAAIKENDLKSESEIIKPRITRNQNIFADERSNELFAKINQFISKGDYSHAIALYTDLLKGKSRMRSPASTYQNRGALYIKVKRYNLAAADFAKAIDIGGLTDEELKSVRYNYAYTLIQVEKFNESVEQLEKSLALKPSDEIKYLKLLGVAYSKAARVDDALRIYELLIKKEPNYAPSYFSAANIYNRFYSDPEKSIETLLSLSSLQPNNASVYYSLGNFYTIIGELGKAENNFNLYKQYKERQEQQQ